MRAPTTVDSETGKVTRRYSAPSDCGKLAYSGRKVAAMQAAIARRDTGENIRHYKCCFCHAWHIGHPGGQPRMLEELNEPA